MNDLDEILELYRLGLDNISDEFLTKGQTKQRLLSLFESLINEVIGEDEQIITTKSKIGAYFVTAKNQLRYKQRAKAKQLLKEMGDSDGKG